MPKIEEKSYGFPLIPLLIMLFVLIVLVYSLSYIFWSFLLVPLFGLIVFYMFFIGKSWQQRIVVSEKGIRLRLLDKSHGSKKLNTIDLPWHEISEISVEMFAGWATTGGSTGTSVILEVIPKSGKPINFNNLGSSRLWINDFIKLVMQTEEFEQLGKLPGWLFPPHSHASILLRKKS